MKALVTGSFGFLGHHVVMALRKRGWEVAGADRIEGAVSPKEERIAAQRGLGIEQISTDLGDLANIMSLVEITHPDVILHTAAQYSVAYTTDACVRYVRNNLAAFTYLMEAAKIHEVKRVVYASSVAISDDGKPSGLYGATKAYGEQCAHAYANRSGIATIGLRFGPIYGPLSRPDTHVYRALEQFLDSKRVKEHSEFLKAVPYIYVEDAASVMADMAMTTRLMHKSSVYLAVADDAYCNIADVLRCAEKLTGRPVRWPLGMAALPERDPRMPDLLPLRLILDYVPRTKLCEGVGSMLDWMRS